MRYDASVTHIDGQHAPVSLTGVPWGVCRDVLRSVLNERMAFPGSKDGDCELLMLAAEMRGMEVGAALDTAAGGGHYRISPTYASGGTLECTAPVAPSCTAKFDPGVNYVDDDDYDPDEEF